MKMLTVALPVMVSAAVLSALALDGRAGSPDAAPVSLEESTVASAPLPAWHPPVAQGPRALPPGHPPVGALAPELPEGHPQCPRGAGSPGTDAADDDGARRMLSI